MSAEKAHSALWRARAAATRFRGGMLTLETGETGELEREKSLNCI